MSTLEFREQCKACNKGRAFRGHSSEFEQFKFCPTCNVTTEWKLKSRPSRDGSAPPESIITEQRNRVEPSEKKLVEMCTSCQTKRAYKGLEMDWQEVSYCEQCCQQTQWKLFERKARSAGAVQPSGRGAVPPPPSAGSMRRNDDDIDDERVYLARDDGTPSAPPKRGVNWKYTAVGVVAGAAIGGVCGFFIGKLIFGAGAVTYAAATTASGKASASAAGVAAQAATDATGRQSTASAVAAMSAAPQNAGAAQAASVVGQETMKTASDAAVAALDKLPAITATASMSGPVTATYTEGVGLGSIAVGAAVGGVAGCTAGYIADRNATRKQLEN
eukprot:PhM_4_TR636/c0_g1_i1/m.86467